MTFRFRSLALLPLFPLLLAASEPNVTHSDAISVKQAIDRLRVTGSVLMIAAHPDDENTALISYLARGRSLRTAYLSLTRGEGGQNVIGPETGAQLGVIRTQELLQSRRVDGAQQFFSRAIDFGFSKTSKEALEKWGREDTLGDVVWIIRKFRPDVVILQFTGTPADGHGQHQASAILGREAFTAAADPARYPDQLKYVRPWQAKRLMMNRRGFTPEMKKEIDALPHKIEVDLGAYNPLLGYSYGELAGISRSFNSSQSDGTARTRGEDKTVLVTVAGPQAKTDLFDAIDTTWRRYKGGEQVDQLLDRAEKEWNPERPERLIALLYEVRTLVNKIDDPDAQAKAPEIDEAIANCAGLWLDFNTDAQDIVSGHPVKLRVFAVRRTDPAVTLQSLEMNGRALAVKQGDVLKENEPLTLETQQNVDTGAFYTQPYWLRQPPVHNRYSVTDPQLVGLAENPAPLALEARVKIGESEVNLRRPVVYRYIDRLRGESITPVAYLPPVSLRLVQPTLVFPKQESKQIQVEVTTNEANAKGTVRVQAPTGWNLEPASQAFRLSAVGEQELLTFTLTPSSGAQSGELKAEIESGGRVVAASVHRISYPHIPLQTLFPKADSTLVRTDAVTLAKRVGYVMGSGDDVPEALRQLGCEVVLLGPNDLARGDLSQYDAIVTGIRAYTERPDLEANQQRLLEYASNGGTLIVQYNRIERGTDKMLDHIGPYPFHIGHERVTEENAPVSFKDSALLSAPNKITERDFEGWVQERGLYFANKWDSHYETPLETHDPGESPLKGGTLVARYGKGVYIFTAFSWFRELPAGVPGAYRIMANFLSASKTLGTGAAQSAAASQPAAGGR